MKNVTQIMKEMDGFLKFFLVLSISIIPVLALPQTLSTLSFDEGYNHLFGDDNLMLLNDGKSVHISLDERTGSGFISQDLYLHGFFSASIKLPADYTAGVVVAFYLSNGDIFEKNHDELDFEFLGNIRGKDWRVQTNVYGNGSTSTGREERCSLWFDPSEDFHRYSILWTENHIAFYVDKTPIRVTKRSDAMGGAYPSKPMSLYTTVWDGSAWATSGGRYKVNYRYAPYIVQISDLVLLGCTVDPIQKLTGCNGNDDDESLSATMKAGISSEEQLAMEKFRKKFVTYSYCYDRVRYPKPLPECNIDRHEAARLSSAGSSIKFGRHGRHHRRNPAGHTATTTV